MRSVRSWPPCAGGRPSGGWPPLSTAPPCLPRPGRRLGVPGSCARVMQRPRFGEGGAGLAFGIGGHGQGQQSLHLGPKHRSAPGGRGPGQPPFIVPAHLPYFLVMLPAQGVDPVQDVEDGALDCLLPHAQQPDGMPGQRRRTGVFLPGEPGQPLEVLLPQPDTEPAPGCLSPIERASSAGPVPPGSDTAGPGPPRLNPSRQPSPPPAPALPVLSSPGTWSLYRAATQRRPRPAARWSDCLPPPGRAAGTRRFDLVAADGACPPKPRTCAARSSVPFANENRLVVGHVVDRGHNNMADQLASSLSADLFFISRAHVLLACPAGLNCLYRLSTSVMARWRPPRLSLSS